MLALESTPCPYCAADLPALWAAENGYSAQRCQGCGFVYVSPRPELTTIDEASRTGQHRIEGGSLGTVGFLTLP